jgi:hypothetical protein
LPKQTGKILPSTKLSGAGGKGDVNLSVLHDSVRNGDSIQGFIKVPAPRVFGKPSSKGKRQAEELPVSHPAIPKEVLVSLDAYLGYFHKIFSREWSDALEVSLRDSIEIHPDGTVTRRTSDDIYPAIQKGSVLASLDYTSVRPPTLSLYEDPSIEVDAKARQGLTEEIDRNMALIKKSGPQILIAQVAGAGHYLFIDHLDDVVKKMSDLLEQNQQR